MKKIDKLLFIFIFFDILIFGCFNSFSSDFNDVKKIISIAYDDSGSMKNNGQDYAYASYGLQNIIGVMNEDDKLSIVKMSDIYNSHNFHIYDYETRKKEIDEVKNFLPIADSSDFQTVKTAVNYLYEEKIKNGSNKDYEYYLVALTDGKFDNYDEKVSKYISEINNKFSDVKYRGIFIGIGDNTSEDFKKDVLTAPNNYYLTTTNNDGIVDALYETHDIIYDRYLINEKDLIYDENNATISFEAKDNIKKIIVFEQGQQIPVLDVASKDVDANKKLIFTGSKDIQPILNSYIVHASNAYVNLPKDKINIEFLDKVDKSYNKLKVFVEYENLSRKNDLSSIVDNRIKNSNNNVSDTNVSDINAKASYDDIFSNDEKNVVDNIGSGKEKINDNVFEQYTDDYKSSKDKVIIEKSKNIIDEEDEFIKKDYLENNNSDVDKNYVEKNYADKNYVDKSNEVINDDTIIEPNTEYTNIGIDSCGLNGCSGFGPNYGLGSCGLNSCGGFGLNYGLGGCGLNGCRGFGANYGLGGYGLNGGSGFGADYGLGGCGLNGCNGLGPSGCGFGGLNNDILNNPNNPTNNINPFNSFLYAGFLPFIFSFLPIFLLLALLYGYLKKPRFDTKYHDFVIKKGNKIIDDGSMIRTNLMSKIFPFYAERGFGGDLFIKAHKDKSKVIIPKKYLTSDMKLDNQEINIKNDLVFYEDSELSKFVDGEKLTYIYRSRPYMEKNNE